MGLASEFLTAPHHVQQIRAWDTSSSVPVWFCMPHHTQDPQHGTPVYGGLCTDSMPRAILRVCRGGQGLLVLCTWVEGGAVKGVILRALPMLNTTRGNRRNMQ